MNSNRISMVVLCLLFGIGIGYFGSRAFNHSVPNYIPSSYHVSSTLQLSGTGGWDYLTFNNNSRQLFITRSSVGVTVVNVDNQQFIGVIENTKGAHGVALAPEFNLGFTSNGSRNTVTVFDLTTLVPVNEVAAGTNPDCIAYDSFMKRIFVINGGSSNITVLDTATGKELNTIAIDSKKPEFAVADDKGTLYVNLEDKNEIITIDTKEFIIKEHWPLGHGEQPAPLAIDKEQGRLFIGCRNSVVVIMDSATGTILSELPIGPGVDAIAYDSATKLAFAANANGTITVIQEIATNKYAVADTIWTQLGARTLALDPTTHNIYTFTATMRNPETVHGRAIIVPDTAVMLTISR